ncbi:carotenoid oxygenase family protein [Parendozoicomonas sp. Alg238-R29]|uniref:carotenoid oxygenase family protein n=1 Tax=Parendozoicomonas sp. Alg238-R29 TaxID=2993446 RepID=UPI00248EC002|nr:carotenoid oxygenase family protein [Parendozoicomonas sp. Alg238-R29]
MLNVLSELSRVLDTRGNPYLENTHAPISREIVANELEVIGEIPKDLTGVYLRNGPNQRWQPQGVYHWFDGDGMMHGVEVRDGQATYRNRWVQTDGLKREAEAEKAIWPGLIDRPDRNLQGWGSNGGLKDSSNTDVVLFNGKLLSMFYQCGEAYQLDPKTLETTGKIDLKGMGARSLSAHSMVDEHTGELIFFDYGTTAPYMTYGVLAPTGELKHFTAIDLPGPRLPHTLSITENYTVLMDLPLFWNPELLKKDIQKVEFYPELPSRFGVIPRYGDGSAIRWFECDPTYIYHMINAWEEGDEIVMDACKTHTPEPTSSLPGPYGNLLAWLKIDPTYVRYRFNLKTGQAKEEPMHDIFTEFPVINSRYYGRKSRFSYHVGFADAPTTMFDSIVKYDIEQGTIQRTKFGDDCFGSEPAFAPRDNSQGEDDGYVVTLVNDLQEQRGEFQIYDAKDVDKGPLARIILPQQVPSGFHGCWAPGDILSETMEGW